TRAGAACRLFAERDAARGVAAAWRRGERSGLAAATLVRIRRGAREQGGRSRQCRSDAVRRLHPRGALSASLRYGDAELAASRSLRLEWQGAPRPSGGRRGAMRAQPLRADTLALPVLS